jgi:crotonobetainyl-CoA:carnitine CoA-transferase CaiB-like acyl-CoA transferase
MFALAQWQERPFFYEVAGNQVNYKVPGPPWRLSGTPARQSASAGQR